MTITSLYPRKTRSRGVAAMARHGRKSRETLEMLDFAFPSDIPMDKEHNLDQLTTRFSELKDGLPELIKNAKDQYTRLGIDDPARRQIIILANTTTRALGVLDFAGANRTDFQQWSIWSNRTGVRDERYRGVEAGHGNGGKAFMVRGSTDQSF